MRRDRKEFHIFRVWTIAALAIAVGSLPFLAAWRLLPGNWYLLGAAVVAPLFLVYVLAIVKVLAINKSIRPPGENKPRGNSSLQPPGKSAG